MTYEAAEQVLSECSEALASRHDDLNNRLAVVLPRVCRLQPDHLPKVVRDDLKALQDHVGLSDLPPHLDDEQWGAAARSLIRNLTTAQALRATFMVLELHSRLLRREEPVPTRRRPLPQPSQNSSLESGQASG